jgi:hypothetical protein
MTTTAPAKIKQTAVTKHQGLIRYIVSSWADLLKATPLANIRYHFLARAGAARDFADPLACLSFSLQARTLTKSSSESFFARSLKRSRFLSSFRNCFVTSFFCCIKSFFWSRSSCTASLSADGTRQSSAVCVPALPCWPALAESCHAAAEADSSIGNNECEKMTLAACTKQNKSQGTGQS